MKAMLRSSRTEREHQERIRTLYVALTRASNRLIVGTQLKPTHPLAGQLNTWMGFPKNPLPGLEVDRKK